MEISNALKKMHAIGMTDADIGAAINTSQATVTRIRNGVHKTTSYERGVKIMELAKRMGISAGKADSDA